MTQEVGFKARITDVIEEYETKINNVDQAIANFEEAGLELKSASCIRGTFGQEQIDIGSVYKNRMVTSIKRSAWLHIYKELKLNRIATAKDQKLFDQAITDPPEFTLDNIRATFGDYILNPRESILTGLAEVFSDLDPAFKSHEKMKIGVKGLPKRVVISNFSSYWGYGQEKLENILNAIAVYQGKPLLTKAEIDAIRDNEDALLNDSKLETYNTKTFEKELVDYPARGVRLRRFKNGNAHLFFEPETLRDVNKALAEFYGEVLADCEDKGEVKKSASKDVSKDLQYYPTPEGAAQKLINNICIQDNDKILEPSCGCGRLLDAIRVENPNAALFGIEIDANRVIESRNKGYSVMRANFLETEPTGDFDKVIMNPPFYGKHYAKHIKHALKFLKEGGTLHAILPATARYDHGLVDGQWFDLPVGSFSESGTNVNTTILTIRV